MINLEPLTRMDDKQRLQYMNLLLKGQLDSEKDDLANLSNASAIIMACVKDLNWAGFYLFKDNVLVLGPFQGKPACNRIEIGKGVCGTAFESRNIQLVNDVEAFPGHIACDGDSKSELVLPIIKGDKVYGVLDLDSPIHSRFTDLERDYFIKFVDILNQYMDWESF